MQRFTYRALLALALPSMAFAILTNGFRLVDQYFIQGVSTEAQAAVSSSMFVIIVFHGLYALFAGGASPLIARATGAVDDERRRRVIGNALTGLLGCVALTALLGGVGAELIVSLLGLHGQAAIECENYLRVLSFTALPLALTPLVDQAFLSMGNARLPMLLHAISLALNIVLTPLLIYDAGLGIEGAALASNLSRALTTGVGLFVLLRRTGTRMWHLRLGPELRRIVKVGVPMTVGIVGYAGVYWAVLYYAVSPLGPHVNAALGIGFSALEGVAWPSFHGIALAAASFVGRGLGAGTPELAWAAIRRCIPLTALLGTAAMLAFWLAGPFLTGLFTDDPLVHAAASEYAFVLAWSQLAVAFETLLFSGVLQGAGDSRRALYLSLPFNVLRIPLCYWLAIHAGWGAMGIWWGINFTTYIKTGLGAVAVARGRWAELEV